MNYRKIWISGTGYRIEQRRDDGTIRWVDEDHGAYVTWLNEGNVPEVVAFVPPIPMRSIPTLIAPTSYANFALADGVEQIVISANPTIDTAGSSNRIVTVACTVASGLTQYRPYKLYAVNQTTDKIGFSAEI